MFIALWVLRDWKKDDSWTSLIYEDVSILIQEASSVVKKKKNAGEFQVYLRLLLLCLKTEEASWTGNHHDSMTENLHREPSEGLWSKETSYCSKIVFHMDWKLINI